MRGRFAFCYERKLILALLASAFTHAILLRVWREPLSPEQNTEALEIRIESTQQNGARDKRRKYREGTQIPLRALLPKWSPSAAANAPNWLESSAYDTDQIGGHSNLDAVSNTFLYSLWNEIERNIEDNPFLAEYGQFGQVYVRFEVNQQGKLEPGSLKASANNRVLKVVAARAVRKALAENVLRPPSERVFVNTRFIWTNQHGCESLRGRRVDFLSFCHFSQNKRKSFTRTEKALTYGRAILQSGPWAIEDIEKYNREESRRKLQFEPFRKYENDRDWNL